MIGVLVAGRLRDLAEAAGFPVPDAVLICAVALVLGSLPAWAGVKWYFQWRYFRRPSPRIPPPGERGTIEGTVVAAEETIPAPHDPSIESVAWHLWDYTGESTTTYSRIRPFVLDTAFGRVHVTVDDRYWHPSLSWDDEFLVREHEEHEEHIRLSLTLAWREYFSDRVFHDDEPLYPIDIARPRMLLVRPGDRITVSGVFETEVPAEEAQGYRGVSPSDETRVLVRAGPSLSRNVIITARDYATMLEFWSRLQFRMRSFIIGWTLLLAFWIAGAIFILERV